MCVKLGKSTKCRWIEAEGLIASRWRDEETKVGAHFVDSLLQPIAKKQESYIKDTTHSINFIENTPLPHKPILWKDLLATYFQCGLYSSEKSTTSSISLVYSTPLSNSRVKCHLKKLFSLTLKFSKDRGSLTTKLWTFKLILSLQKLFNIRPSLRVTLSVFKRVLSKERPCVYWEQTRSITRAKLPPGTRRENLSRSRLLITIWGITINKTTTSNNVLQFVSTLNPATPNLRKILMNWHWHLIAGNNKLAQAFPKPPIVAYRKDKSLKDI